MKRRDFLEKWGLTSLKINLHFLQGGFAPRDPDGDEKTALESVYAIFKETRGILRRHGSGCGKFAKLAIPIAFC
jgi:hypothetical protein